MKFITPDDCPTCDRPESVPSVFTLKNYLFLMCMTIALLLLVFNAAASPLGVVDSLSQLLAYICFNSLLVILLTTVIRSNIVMGFVWLLLAAISGLYIFSFQQIMDTDAEKQILLILFPLNNLFMITGTRLFLKLLSDSREKLVVFRYFVVSFNIAFYYLFAAVS